MAAPSRPPHSVSLKAPRSTSSRGPSPPSPPPPPHTHLDELVSRVGRRGQLAGRRDAGRRGEQGPAGPRPAVDEQEGQGHVGFDPGPSQRREQVAAGQAPNVVQNDPCRLGTGGLAGPGPSPAAGREQAGQELEQLGGAVAGRAGGKPLAGQAGPVLELAHHAPQQRPDGSGGDAVDVGVPNVPLPQRRPVRRAGGLWGQGWGLAGTGGGLRPQGVLTNANPLAAPGQRP